MEVQTAVTVYADAPPLASHGYCATDLTSLRIFGLCALPLTSVNSDGVVSLLGAVDLQASHDSKHFAFTLRKDLFWNDGTRITGHDYARAVHKIMRTRGLRFRTIFSDVLGYSECLRGEANSLLGLSCDDDSIAFSLRFANRLFPELMSFCIISPLHPHDEEQCPGAYEVSTRSTEKWSIKSRNTFPELSKSLPKVALIHFDLNKSHEDPFALSRYANNAVALTCDTFFPYEEVSDHKTRADFALTNTRIHVYLSSQGCHIPIGSDVLSFLNASIDRVSLAHKLYDVPQPWLGFGEDNHDLSCQRRLASISGTLIPIAYEDFSPNAQILSHLDDMLLPQGIRIVPVKASYGDRITECALRLELFINPIADPLLFYRSMGARSKLHQNQKLGQAYLEALSRYQIASSDQRPSLAKSMDALLHKQGIFVPLLTLPGLELKRERLKHYAYQPGNFWHWA